MVMGRVTEVVLRSSFWEYRVFFFEYLGFSFYEGVGVMVGGVKCD